MNNRALHAIFMVVTPLMLVAVWWAYVRVFNIPRFVLPPPAEVGAAFVALFHDGTIWPHLAHTLGIILAGFAIGSALGFVLGFILAKSPRTERIIGPYLFFFQTAPKIALAPLFILWFGLGLTSQIVLAVSLVFFPVMVGTILGLRSVPANFGFLQKSSPDAAGPPCPYRTTFGRARDLRRPQGRRCAGHDRCNPGRMALRRAGAWLFDGLRRDHLQDADAVRDGAGHIAAGHPNLPVARRAREVPESVLLSKEARGETLQPAPICANPV